MSVYAWDMHDLGQSTFQSIQNQALRDEQVKALEAQAASLEAGAASVPVSGRALILGQAAALRTAADNLRKGVVAPASDKASLSNWFSGLSTGGKVGVGLALLGLGAAAAWGFHRVRG